MVNKLLVDDTLNSMMYSTLNGTVNSAWECASITVNSVMNTLLKITVNNIEDFILNRTVNNILHIVYP